MSITISNCDEICHSLSNNSKSKMLYTFSKGERFPKRRVIMCDKFYDSHDLSFNRTTSLGLGNKYDFTKASSKSPPPNSYQIKSEFQGNQKKGFGFGCSREELEVTGPFVETLKNKNPGPGAYQLKNTLDGNSFSMRGKNDKDDHEKLKVPGPGHYPVAFSINQKDNKVPGPGAYDVNNKVDISPDGKYCLSRIPSVLSRRFGNATRSQAFGKCETPGPGNYRIPSEFGYYCAKDYAKKPATEENSRKNHHNKENKETKQTKENKENVI